MASLDDDAAAASAREARRHAPGAQVVERRVDAQGGSAVIRRRKRAPEPAPEPAVVETVRGRARADRGRRAAPARRRGRGDPRSPSPSRRSRPRAEIETPGSVRRSRRSRRPRTAPAARPPPARRPGDFGGAAAAAAAAAGTGKAAQAVREVVNLREQEQLAKQAVTRLMRRSSHDRPAHRCSRRGAASATSGAALRPSASAPRRPPSAWCASTARSRVAELAHQLGAKAAEVQGRLMALGTMVSVNQTIELETASQGRGALRLRGAGRRLPGGRGPRRGGRDRCGRDARAAAAGRHRDGSRRPRQDVAARRDPQDQGGRRRGRRHHAAHRRLPGVGRRAPHHLHRHARPRGLHADARARRRGDRHRRARGRGDRGHHAPDGRGHRSRQGRRTCRSSWRSTSATCPTRTRSWCASV